MIDQALIKKHGPRLRRNGFNDKQIAVILSSISDNNIDMYQEYMSKAFLMTMGIVLNVLLADYWPKAGKYKIRKFMDTCIELFDAADKGTTKWDEIAEYIYDETGVVIKAEWLSNRDIPEGSQCVRLGEK